MPPIEKPKSPKEVPVMLDLLRVANERLHKSILELSERLTPVTSQRIEQVEIGRGESARATALGHDLQDLLNALDENQRLIQRLNDSVEL